MRHHHTIIVLSLIAIAALSTPGCAVPQNKGPDATPASSTKPSAPALGETVSAIDHNCSMALHDTNNYYWFNSGSNGVYRFESKPGARATITRFTTKDGLCSDHVGGMQQYGPTNDIVIATSNGFCKFDGSAFSKITVLDPSKSEWKIQPDDLWFSAGQDTGAVFRYDGKVVHRLTFPTTKAGDAHYKELPRDKFPNAKYSPYDVYSIYRDSKGHMWFATATLGACRYDGTTFAWFVKPAVELDNFGTRSIIQDKDGKYLFSSTPNRYTFDPSPPNPTPNPTKDATQNAGAGVRGVTVEIKYHMEPGFGTAEDPFSVFMSAVKDKNGDLWLCTLGAGVFRYDGTKMTRYPVTHDGAPIWVHTISLDRQDNPWLATTEHGTYKFNGDKFEKFTLKAD